MNVSVVMYATGFPEPTAAYATPFRQWWERCPEPTPYTITTNAPVNESEDEPEDFCDRCEELEKQVEFLKEQLEVSNETGKMLGDLLKKAMTK
jgi:hypothetical protein